MARCPEDGSRFSAPAGAATRGRRDPWSFEPPIRVMLETGAGGPSLIEDAEDGAVAMRRGRWRAGRLDANGRRRPEWTAAFDALVKARLDPAPDTVEAARASLHRLAASIGLLAGS